jgi:hypothetical protein
MSNTRRAGPRIKTKQVKAAVVRQPFPADCGHNVPPGGMIVPRPGGPAGWICLSCREAEFGVRLNRGEGWAAAPCGGSVTPPTP